MTRTARTIPLVLLCLTFAGGCRNPFNPSADIELVEVTNTSPDASRTQLWVNCTSILSAGTVWYTNYRSTLHFVVKNKVLVTIRRVRMVYTDPLGNEVTTYKNVGGRTFNTLYRFDSPTNNNQANYNYGEGVDNTIDLYPLDSKVLETIDGYPYDIMYVTYTIYGDDENGYDVRLSATTTIVLFGVCKK
jgi:hypothetical protein